MRKLRSATALVSSVSLDTDRSDPAHRRMTRRSPKNLVRKRGALARRSSNEGGPTLLRHSRSSRDPAVSVCLWICEVRPREGAIRADCSVPPGLGLAAIMAKKGLATFRAPGLSSRQRVPPLHTNLKPPPPAKKALPEKKVKKKKGDESYSDEEKVSNRARPFLGAALLLTTPCAALVQAQGPRRVGRRRPPALAKATTSDRTRSSG